MTKQSEVERLAKVLYEEWHKAIDVNIIPYEDVSKYHKKMHIKFAQAILDEGYLHRDHHRQATKKLLERISRKLVRHQNDKRLSAIMNEFIDAEIAKLEEKG